PLPVKDPERLVMVLQRSAAFKLPHGHSWPDYQDYRQRVAPFEDALALFMSPVHMSAPGQEPDRTWIEAVSGNYFPMLGIAAGHGRVFRAEEGRVPGADPVVVLSHDYWQRKFGADPALVGQAIVLNGHPFTVIGIAPAGFNSAQWAIAPSAFVPATMLGQIIEGGAELLEQRGAPAFKVMARLEPDATLAQARAAVEVVARQLAADYPKEHVEARVSVVPEPHCRPEPTFSDFMPLAAAVFMVLVGLVLLIACANVANLMFSRALVRQREMGIRTALGATRWRLTRQLLTESVVLALLAGGVGTLVASWGAAALAGFNPAGDIPVRTDQAWGWRTFVFTGVISLVAGVVTGIVPALRATRLDVQTILKEGGHAPSSCGRHLFRSGLVIGQVALCLVVLSAGGLFLESLRQAARFDLGFRTDRLLMASLDLGLQGYEDPRGRQFLEQLTERLEALPGVEAAAVAGVVPFDYGVRMADLGAEGQISEGTPGKDGYQAVAFNPIGVGYLKTTGLTLLRGRDFNTSDHAAAPKVALINQVLAQKFWPDQDPLGKRFRFDRGGEFTEVVGVVRDGKYVMIGEEPRPYVYIPLDQRYSSPATVHVRTTGDPLTLVPTLRQVLAELDPHLPIYNVRTMTEHLRNSALAMMPLRMGATLAGVQGILGLLLAVMGIYGVVSYAVSQRTREIGVRIALGAKSSDVLRLVVREGFNLTLIGLGIGWVLSIGLAYAIGRLLHGLTPVSLPVLAAVLALLTGVALLACYVPARRATRVDPMMALRYE
ncbi:MAG: ABC transporter permease, partial [Verrucomicrobia bacterium]|nr:ABC transporter permease [Verrucomicrobiota bacterium]